MLTIKKTTCGRWEVLGANAAYGHSDSDCSPVCPPSFKTRRAAVDFAERVIGRGEAQAYQIAK